MKLFAFFATAIFAQDDAYAAPTDPPTVAPTTKAPEPVDIDIAWPGQTETNPCGSQISTNMENAVNKTCTISYPDAYKPFRKFLGGTFITGENEFTSFDGAGNQDTIDVVIFWEQDEKDDGTMDNSTCAQPGELKVTCVDNGDNIYDGVYFMETTNDHRNAKAGNYNFQIYGAKPTDVLALELTDSYGNEYACQNLSTNSGEIVVDGTNVQMDPWGNIYSDNGKIMINVGDQSGIIVNLFTTQQPGMNWEPDTFTSTVIKG